LQFILKGIIVCKECFKKGEGPKAEDAKNKILQAFKSGSEASGEALRYVGEMTFLNTQAVYKKALTVSLKGGSVDALQGSIQALSAATLSAEQAHNEVFATRDSFWAVASFYQLGYAYERFADQLKNPPAIKGAKPSDVKAQLQSSVDEVVAKSKSMYSSGLQTSRQFTVYSDYTPLLFNGLSRIMQRTTTFEELVLPPDFLGDVVPDVVKSSVL
jgi:hypothetical protein